MNECTSTNSGEGFQKTVVLLTREDTLSSTEVTETLVEYEKRLTLCTHKSTG